MLMGDAQCMTSTPYVGIAAGMESVRTDGTSWIVSYLKFVEF